MIKESTEKNIPSVGTVSYYLLEYQNPLEFGISISLDSTGEKCEIPHICSDEHAALALYKSIVDGCVTPISIHDIVYDWLCT